MDIHFAVFYGSLAVVNVRVFLLFIFIVLIFAPVIITV